MGIPLPPTPPPVLICMWVLVCINQLFEIKNKSATYNMNANTNIFVKKFLNIFFLEIFVWLCTLNKVLIHCELEKERQMQGSQAFSKLLKKAFNLKIELKIFRKTCHFTKSLTPVLVLQKFQFYYRLARQNLLPGFYSILYLLCCAINIQKFEQTRS